MKNSIVTGGCGFIGRNLTKKLLSLDHDVLIVDDLSTGLEPELWLSSDERSRITFVHLPCESEKARDSVVQFSQNSTDLYLFHFASIIKGRKFIEAFPFHISHNLHIDTSILRLAAEIKPSHFIYPSSSAVYPVIFQEQETFRALHEDMVSPSSFSAPDQTYGWSKLMGEIHATILFEKFRVPTTIVRPFSGYGPDQSLNYPMPAIVQRFINKEDPLTIWGSGTQLRDFVYIDDLIDAIFLGIKFFPEAQPINIGSGIATSFMSVIEELSELTAFRPEIINDPSKPEGVYGRFCDPGKLLAAADWKPKHSLRDGLEKMISAAKEKEG